MFSCNRLILHMGNATTEVSRLHRVFSLDLFSFERHFFPHTGEALHLNIRGGNK